MIKVEFLKNISATWQKSLFLLMTTSAIFPLYFENLAQVGGLVFLATLLVLVPSSSLQGKAHLGKPEKYWVWVSIIYALVLLLSFLLRPPYVEDGVWRMSAPGFILLLLAWFWVASKLEIGIWVIKSVAYPSIMFAIILFVLEIKALGGWVEHYRYGAVLADVGKTGFLLPLTTALFAFLFLATKKKYHLVFFIIGFILSTMILARTSLVLISIPLIFLVLYSLFGSFSIKKSYKIWMAILVLGVMSVVLYVSKDKLLETVHDYQQATQQNNFQTSMGLRFAMSDLGVEVIKNNFWLGVGPNQYKSVLAAHAEKSEYPAIVQNSIKGFTHIHNQFIMDMMLTGIMGFLALILFIGYPLWFFVKLFKAGKKLDAIYGLGFVAGLWFILFFGAIFTYTYTTIFYVLFIGSIVQFYLPNLKDNKHA